MSSNLKILVIGSGFITEHYLKAISANNIKCVVVGRGEKNVNKLSKIFKNIKFQSGGLEKFLKHNSIEKFTHFTNLVNIEYCIPITELLLNYSSPQYLNCSRYF